MVSPCIDDIFALYERCGSMAYGEAITQTEHALQCAALAASEGAEPALVAAALLHDVGHLVEKADDDYGTHRHDRSGANFLVQNFSPEVVEPVRLHVAAKRYLCAMDNGYRDKLSQASVHTLEKQGGPMSAEEMRVFQSEPFHAAALRLRGWDDRGKVEGLRIPGLEHYRALLESLV